MCKYRINTIIKNAWDAKAESAFSKGKNVEQLFILCVKKENISILLVAKRQRILQKTNALLFLPVRNHIHRQTVLWGCPFGHFEQWSSFHPNYQLVLLLLLQHHLTPQYKPSNKAACVLHVPPFKVVPNPITFGWIKPSFGAEETLQAQQAHSSSLFPFFISPLLLHLKCSSFLVQRNFKFLDSSVSKYFNF